MDKGPDHKGEAREYGSDGEFGEQASETSQEEVEDEIQSKKGSEIIWSDAAIEADVKADKEAIKEKEARVSMMWDRLFQRWVSYKDSGVTTMSV